MSASIPPPQSPAKTLFEEPPRCKRFLQFIIAPIASAATNRIVQVAVTGALLSTGIGLISEEQARARALKDQEIRDEVRRDQLERIRQHQEWIAAGKPPYVPTTMRTTTRQTTSTTPVTTTSSTTTTVASTTTSATSTTTRDPASNRNRVLLVNYELVNFHLIPRSLFTFHVEPLEGFDDIDVEYMLINPSFVGTTSPDRFGHRFDGLRTSGSRDEHSDYLHSNAIGSHSSIDNEEYWRDYQNVITDVDNIRTLSRTIADRVESSNRNLRSLQLNRFTARAQQMRGIAVPGPSEERNHDERDHELSEAFFHSVDQIAELMDQRTINSGHLMHRVRSRDCISFGMAMRSHASQMGVRNIPRFESVVEAPGFHRLSSEEREWLSNPTTFWYPRGTEIPTFFHTREGIRDRDGNQDPILVEFPQGPEENLEPEFDVPNYAESGYQEVLPTFNRRFLDNTNVNIRDSLEGGPYTSDESSSSGDSDGDDGDHPHEPQNPHNPVGHNSVGHNPVGHQHQGSPNQDHQNHQVRPHSWHHPVGNPIQDQSDMAYNWHHPVGQPEAEVSHHVVGSNAPSISVPSSDPTVDIQFPSTSGTSAFEQQARQRLIDRLNESDDSSSECSQEYEVTFQNKRRRLERSAYGKVLAECKFKARHRFNTFLEIFEVPPK